jgi:DNA topoisomerase-1
VFIAEDLENSKLLARGQDAKGRTQSIYSAAHTESQAEAKFKRIKELARHLDKLDAAIERDAMEDDSAAALLLIRRLGMRPGSDQNTGAERQAYGATNLRAQHAKVTPGGKTNLDFIGKKGVHIKLSTKDPLIAEVVASRLETRSRSTRLFDTNEAKTREYMRTAGGVPSEFQLKDLRTLHANVVAMREIEKRRKAVPKNKTEFRRWRREVATAVSAELGNTPALALSSYINPVVFSKWLVDEEWA